MIDIQANQCAFCAILKDGDTLVWGDRNAGGLWNGKSEVPATCAQCKALNGLLQLLQARALLLRGVTCSMEAA